MANAMSKIYPKFRGTYGGNSGMRDIEKGKKFLYFLPGKLILLNTLSIFTQFFEKIK